MSPTLRRVAALLSGLLLASAVSAQTYPSKPVTLLVPYPAGGISDVIARTVNNTLSKQLGQPVIVDNLGGASGSIAAQKVLNAPADGQIIFQGSPNELILAPLAISAVKFKSEDFRLVQMIATAQIGFLARKDLPVRNVDEFLDYARKEAAQGRPITYASVGPGSFYHLLGEHMSKQIGVPMTHVPYKGPAPAVQDMLGGQVECGFLAGPTVLPHIRAGRLNALAVSGIKRSPLLPEVPTIAESGFPKFDATFSLVLFAPKNTPAPVVQKMYESFSDALKSQDLIDKLTQSDQTVAAEPPVETASRLAQDTQRWGEVARKINLRLE